MSYKLTGIEIRKALKDIEQAEKNGFMFCEAIFEPSKVDGVFIELNYHDLSEKAHPTDGNLNWGRFQGVSKNYKFKKGKLIKIRG